MPPAQWWAHKCSWGLRFPCCAVMHVARVPDHEARRRGHKAVVFLLEEFDLLEMRDACVENVEHPRRGHKTVVFVLEDVGLFVMHDARGRMWSACAGPTRHS